MVEITVIKTVGSGQIKAAAVDPGQAYAAFAPEHLIAHGYAVASKVCVATPAEHTLIVGSPDAVEGELRARELLQ